MANINILKEKPVHEVDNKEGRKGDLLKSKVNLESYKENIIKKNSTDHLCYSNKHQEIDITQTSPTSHTDLPRLSSHPHRFFDFSTAHLQQLIILCQGLLASGKSLSKYLLTIIPCTLFDPTCTCTPLLHCTTSPTTPLTAPSSGIGRWGRSGSHSIPPPISLAANLWERLVP